MHMYVRSAPRIGNLSWRASDAAFVVDDQRSLPPKAMMIEHVRHAEKLKSAPTAACPPASHRTSPTAVRGALPSAPSLATWEPSISPSNSLPSLQKAPRVSSFSMKRIEMVAAEEPAISSATTRQAAAKTAAADTAAAERAAAESERAAARRAAAETEAVLSRATDEVVRSQMLLHHGDVGRAELLARAALATRSEVLGETHSDSRRCADLLARILATRQCVDEAAAPLLEAIRKLRGSSEHDEHPLIYDLTLALSALRHASGRTREANEVRRARRAHRAVAAARRAVVSVRWRMWKRRAISPSHSRLFSMLPPHCLAGAARSRGSRQAHGACRNHQGDRNDDGGRQVLHLERRLACERLR